MKRFSSSMVHIWGIVLIIVMHLDKKGQVNAAALAVNAIIGILALIIFVEFYASANKDNVSSGAENILDLTDLIIAGVIVISLLAGLTFAFTRR